NSDMAFGTAMGCASQRNFRITEAETIGCAGFDCGQALDRLDRRAWIDRPVDRTDSEHEPSVWPRDSKRAAMAAFNAVATQHLDEDRVRHLHLHAKKRDQTKLICHAELRLSSDLFAGLACCSEGSRGMDSSLAARS